MQLESCVELLHLVFSCPEDIFVGRINYYSSVSILCIQIISQSLSLCLLRRGQFILKDYYRFFFNHLLAFIEESQKFKPNNTWFMICLVFREINIILITFDFIDTYYKYMYFFSKNYQKIVLSYEWKNLNRKWCQRFF